MSTPPPLADIQHELTYLERLVSKLASGQMGNPHKLLRDGEERVREIADFDLYVMRHLEAVHDQYPGAYTDLNDIANYRSARRERHLVRAAAQQLAKDGRIELIDITFGSVHHLMARVPTGQRPSIDDVEKHVNTGALHDAGYRITLAPARMISTNFTAVLIVHDGVQYKAYLHTYPYDVKLHRYTS